MLAPAGSDPSIRGPVPERPGPRDGFALPHETPVRVQFHLDSRPRSYHGIVRGRDRQARALARGPAGIAGDVERTPGTAREPRCREKRYRWLFGQFATIDRDPETEFPHVQGVTATVNQDDLSVGRRREVEPNARARPLEVDAGSGGHRQARRQHCSDGHEHDDADDWSYASLGHAPYWSPART